MRLLKSPVPVVRACFRRQSTTPEPNAGLIQMLTQYMEEEKASAAPNAYKVRAYSKAISAIGRIPGRVQSVDQVSHLDGIGVRIAKRIDAYLSGTPYEPPRSTSTLRVVEPRKTIAELRREQVVSSLSTVSSIGPSKANALYDAGCRTIEDLREPRFLQMLNRAQQINAQYRIGLDRRVTREQALAARDLVAQSASPDVTVLLGGDFRRGAESAKRISLAVLDPQTGGVLPPEGPPDVDSTIHQKARYHTIPSPFAGSKGKTVGARDFLTEIVSPLESGGLVAATIAASTQKWSGILRIPEGGETIAERRRAVQKHEGHFFGGEIFRVPRRCAGAALIALTGDAEFNLAIRRAASRLGFRLNEYGLWRWRDSGCWELIASEREEDIFEGVEMAWVPPGRRNFANLDVDRRRKGEV